MAETNLMVASRQKEHELLPVELEEGRLLAAALVAALVEYRQHAKLPTERETVTGTGANWRMMSRWQQLRG
jgi:hypothetical protein